MSTFLIRAAAAWLLASPAFARHAPDRLLVRFRPGAAAADQTRALDDLHGRVAADLPAIRFKVVTLPPGRTVEEAIARLSRNPNVEVAEPDMVLHAAALPNDPLAPLQWPLNRISASLCWASDVPGATGSASIIIAIVDTGVNLAHEDLMAKLVAGVNLVNAQNPPEDDHGHGTAVAAVAAADTNNAKGVAGVAWNARLMPVKVLNFNGEGYESLNLLGVQWAMDHGARVINMSIGSCDENGDCGSPSVAGTDMMEAAWRAGVVLVAAAGNDPREEVSWPAGYPHVMGIAATGPDDRITSYSTYGSAVDLAAPGGVDCSNAGGVLSACANQWICPAPSSCGGPCACSTSPYDPVAGTSFASPVVAGAAAVLLGQNPARSPDEVMTILERSADHPDGAAGWNKFLGYGRVNLYRALTGAGTPPPAAARDDIGYAYPNPFSPPLDGFLTFVFPGAPAAPVRVDLFDAAGNLVRTLNAPAGADLYYNSPVRWNGRDGQDRDLAGGVYTARLTAGSASTIKRIILAR